MRSYWIFNFVVRDCDIEDNFLSYIQVVVTTEVPQGIFNIFNKKRITKMFMKLYIGNQYPWCEDRELQNLETHK